VCTRDHFVEGVTSSYAFFQRNAVELRDGADVALFVSGGTQMTDGAVVERLGLLQAGHAAHREC
jgi:hypothetical protein